MYPLEQERRDRLAAHSRLAGLANARSMMPSIRTGSSALSSGIGFVMSTPPVRPVSHFA